MNRGFKHVLLNTLGIHYMAVNPSLIVIMPNTGVILSSKSFSISEVKTICDMIVDFVGEGEPLYKDYCVCDNVKGSVILNKEDNLIIYVPKMSYLILHGDVDRITDNIESILSTVLAILAENGVSLKDLVRDKAFRQYVNGKIVTLPELKEECDAVASGGISRDIMSIINKYVGKIVRGMVRNLRFKYVKNVGKINSITLDVTLPIKKVVIAVDSEIEFDLDTPIILRGTVRADPDHVHVDGDLRYHPNINSYDGNVCLGTVPPFDGTLEWVARLLNTLMVARVDSCADAYSVSFMNKYGDMLPSEAVNEWSERCGEHYEDEEYYEEDYEDEEDYDGEGW